MPIFKTDLLQVDGATFGHGTQTLVYPGSAFSPFPNFAALLAAVDRVPGPTRVLFTQNTTFVNEVFNWTPADPNKPLLFECLTGLANNQGTLQFATGAVFTNPPPLVFKNIGITTTSVDPLIVLNTPGQQFSVEIDGGAVNINAAGPLISIPAGPPGSSVFLGLRRATLASNTVVDQTAHTAVTLRLIERVTISASAITSPNSVTAAVDGGGMRLDFTGCTGPLFVNSDNRYQSFPPGAGTTAQRPTAIKGLVQYQQYFDTDLASGRGKLITWNGTNWIDGGGNIV